MTPSPADPKGLRAEIYTAIATGIRLDLPASEIAARVIAVLDAATPAREGREALRRKVDEIRAELCESHIGVAGALLDALHDSLALAVDRPAPPASNTVQCGAHPYRSGVGGVASSREGREALLRDELSLFVKQAELRHLEGRGFTAIYVLHRLTELAALASAPASAPPHRGSK